MCNVWGVVVYVYNTWRSYIPESSVSVLLVTAYRHCAARIGRSAKVSGPVSLCVVWGFVGLIDAKKNNGKQMNGKWKVISYLPEK